jgi:tetratricopeptide (TPR) repeat protein
MRKALKRVSDRLEAFVEQRDDVTLILAAATTDALPLLTMLEGIEEARASDFFWTFTEPFAGATAYASAVVESFRAKHEAVRLAMQREGLQPWPPIPAPALSGAPAARLRALAAFARELFPVPDGGLAVWTYFPLEVSDPAAFARLMGEVVDHEFPFPWCHHLRFILRDDPAARTVERVLSRSPRVQRYAPDLGADALERSLDEELADESLPLAERMASLLVSAGNDLAFARFPAALEKLALLLKYHGSMNNLPMGAVALHLMGQVYERSGDLEKAEQAYHAALVPASQGEHPTVAVLSNVVASLANLRASQERWAEAEGYWDSAQQLATACRDAPQKVRALEQRGHCQERQGKAREAEQSWHAGSVVAAQLEDAPLCADLLERLYRLHGAAGRSAKQRELRDQLSALGRRV